MGDKTAIEWADATWNVFTGCTKVSEGCRACYIARTPPFRINRRHFEGGHGDEAIGATTGLVFHHERLDQPVRWKRPRRIFVNSLSDLFHEDALRETVTDRYGTTWPLLAEMFAVMVRCEQHTFQILTKRPRIMRAVLSEPRFRLDVNAILLRDLHPVMPGGFESKWPSNIWLGVSAENQRWYDQRVPLLLDTPAAVRFVSIEPLLGPIDLEPAALRVVGSSRQSDGTYEPDIDIGLDWVIVGGESAGERDRALVTWTTAGAQRMYEYDRNVQPKPEAIEWVRSLRDQCVAAGVSFTFKQWGGPTAKAGGRDLDGRTWDERPPLAAERSNT